MRDEKKVYVFAPKLVLIIIGYSMINLASILLFEHPKAEGRCICSSHDATILDLVKLHNQKFPEYHVPS